MQKTRFLLVLITCMSFGIPGQAETRVLAKPLPFEGRHPRALSDAAGNVHLLFNRKGNVYYSLAAGGDADFSTPIRVNSVEGSAAAANLAVDGDGRVHVFYHGNIFYVRKQIEGEDRRLRPADIKYAFYSRMNDQGDAFEEQRDLSGGVWGFDGSGAVAADQQGRVYLFFGGTTTTPAETDRRVFLRRSEDGGKTFSEPRPVDLGKGVCACCHLNATVTAGGRVMLAYRVAQNGVQRDSFVLASDDLGENFQATPLDQWELRACPGSLYSFANNAKSTVVAWRNQDQVYWTGLDGPAEFVVPPDKTQKRRAAALATNQRNEVLMAWAEAENFNKPHALRWQLFTAAGQPAGSGGSEPMAFSRWGNPAVYADADGNFVVLY